MSSRVLLIRDSSKRSQLAGLCDSRRIEIVGEAATLVGRLRERRIRRFRGHESSECATALMHAYFDIDLGIVWDTVEKDIPRLIPHLERLTRPAGTAGRVTGAAIFGRIPTASTDRSGRTRPWR